MQMRKHVGKIVNTDQRCVVVFMQIPDNENNALVIQVGNLPPQIEEYLNDIVDSREAQNEPVLANVLNRRFYTPEKTFLVALHELGLLQVVPIDNIVMLPRPNMPFPLREVIKSMNSLGEEMAEPVERFNPYAANGEALNDETKLSIARNLIIEAELLEADAKAKREQAYMYYPDLRPAAVKEPTRGLRSNVSEAPVIAEDGEAASVTVRRKATKRASSKAKT